MIYLTNTTTAQSVKVPLNGDFGAHDYHLKLYSTIDLERVVDTSVTVTASSQYLTFSVTLPADLPSGEYSYELTDGAAVASKGLAIVGDYDGDTTEYNISVQYEQYES